MTFKQKLKEAGFKSKREFAKHVGKDPTTVTRWGETPPQWVGIYLTLRVRVLKFAGDVL